MIIWHVNSTRVKHFVGTKLLRNTGNVSSAVTTVFGKHCECIAQKCTHLERLPPLASQLLLLSHCVLTQHIGQKKSHLQWSHIDTQCAGRCSTIRAASCTGCTSSSCIPSWPWNVVEKILFFWWDFFFWSYVKERKEIGGGG